MSPELENLTPKQQKAVCIAALPEVNGSYAETARRLGVTKQSAHRMLTATDPAKALVTRKARHLDKARGSLAKIARAERKLLSRLEETADSPDLTPAEIGGLVKISLEARKLLTDMGVDEEAPDPNRFTAFLDRALLLATRKGWDACKAGEERP